MRNSCSNSSSSTSSGGGGGGGEVVGVSRKARFQNQEDGQVIGVDLGLKLQHHQNRSFLCNQTDTRVTTTTTTTTCDGDDDDNHDGDGRRKGGPTLIGGYNNTNATNNTNTPTLSDIYDVGVGVGDCSSVYSTAGVGVVRGLQPFDVSYSYPSVSVSSHPFFRHSPASGGMGAGGVGYPFTVAQWKELERQAMIYKYMMASLPVPPDLLYSSFTTTPPCNTTATFAPAASYLLGKYGNGLNLRWVGGNNKDAEPGRCKRTDGKKWRCSRDVAPNQKYCERHMHRGRPRSRKPVELLHHHSLSDFPINNNNNPTKKTKLNVPDPLGSSNASVTVSRASASDHHPTMVSAASSFEDSRSLAWTEEQQWQHLVQTNMNPQVYQHQFQEEPLNLNSHSGFNAKSDIGLLERPLIDAWSMGVTGTKGNCGSNNRSSFTSNVGHGNAVDEDMCQIQMGLGVIDSWAGSPTSPGGPLAEVLRPGAVATTTTRTASNPPTFDVGESDFVTPPATAVSSPSGVLQKTLASFSDSSGSSSPTCHNSRANSDVPFHWLN